MKVIFDFNNDKKKFFINTNKLTYELSSLFTRGLEAILFDKDNNLEYYYNKMLSFVIPVNDNDRNELYNNFDFFVCLLSNVNINIIKYMQRDVRKDYESLYLHLFHKNSKGNNIIQLTLKLISIIKSNVGNNYDLSVVLMQLYHSYINEPLQFFLVYVRKVCDEHGIDGKSLVDFIFFNETNGFIKYIEGLLQTTMKLNSNNQKQVEIEYLSELLRSVKDYGGATE